MAFEVAPISAAEGLRTRRMQNVARRSETACLGADVHRSYEVCKSLL